MLFPSLREAKERKAAEKAREEARKLNSQLFAGVAQAEATMEMKQKYLENLKNGIDPMD